MAHLLADLADRPEERGVRSESVVSHLDTTIDGPPFVGREREIALGEEALSRARKGDGTVLVVSGAAGMGKSRLCEELSRRARAQQFTVSWGRCWTDGGSPPLWPWPTILGELDASAADLLRPTPGPDGVVPERFARFSAVIDRLRVAAARSPLLVIIDDIHAADPGAVLLARFLARHRHNLRMAFVATCRTGDPVLTGSSEELVDQLVRDGTGLSLGPLDAAQAVSLLARSGVDDLDRHRIDGVLEMTAGVPLLLTQALDEHARSSATDASDDWAANVVRRRLMHLEPGPRRTLCRAAVLGTRPAVAEAAAVADIDVSELLDQIKAAALLGLIVEGGTATFEFAHDVVRDALVAELTPAQLIDAHARAADLLGRGTSRGWSERLARRARHAVGAAARSPDDAERAVFTCRVAARAAGRRFANERAVALLDDAVTVHESARLDGPTAPLLVERAVAVQGCGDLGRARALFDRAAEAATEEAGLADLAEATLGCCGLWVHEQRSHLERERVLGILRQCLDELPADARSLRHRVTTRLAAEDVYRGGPVGPVLASLAAARQDDDAATLADVLAVAHHALLSPRHAEERLVLAQELITVASAAGDAQRALLGLCWRTVDLFLLGRPDAYSSWAELTDRAEVMGCRHVQYVAATLKAMVSQRAGRLTEAEEAASAALELGTEVGDADALAWFGGQLMAIRWLQGRGLELLESIEALEGSPTLAQSNFAFPAVASSLAAPDGQRERARAALDRALPRGPEGLPESSTWLVTLFSASIAVDALGDRDLAERIYQTLAPFSHLPVMASLAVTCLGSVEHALGLMARAVGNDDTAIAHFEQAGRLDRRLGNGPMVAMAAAELAETHLQRGRPGDEDAARQALEQAVAEARAVDLDTRAQAWEERLAELSSTGIGRISRQGGHWLVEAAGEAALVPNSVGMGYLFELLRNPGTAIPAARLAGGGHEVAEGATQQVLDDQAVVSYRRRGEELATELQQAEDDADRARAEHLRLELDALEDEVLRSVGPGGRTRTFAGPSERARTSVRKALKRALDHIDAAAPVLGDALRRSIHTGRVCSYEPSGEAPPTWHT